MTALRRLYYGSCSYNSFAHLKRYKTSGVKLKTGKKGGNKKFSDTLNLPKTNFPLRIEPNLRKEAEERIFEECQFSLLYAWQRKYAKGTEFILHDGPPYANGKPHMGHAVNKILKDIILRRNLLKGHKIHFIPGWDCHGLPIELKALTPSDRAQHKISAVDVRSKARKFAEDAIHNQKSVFKSWGILADWDECYYTYDNRYVKNQINQFYSLYQKGLIYRAYKPVFWSPSSRTALAEAELEYCPSHRSTAVTVRFKVKDLPPPIKEVVVSDDCVVYALIWTTTPWTLPMNRAISYHPELLYSLVCINNMRNETYLIASDCIEILQSKLEVEIKIISSFKGNMLQQTTYEHPLKKGEMLPLLPADHVSTSKGTGLVHTAPAHGQDDFLVALRYGLNVDCLVNGNGCFIPEIGQELSGLPVLSSGNEKVLQLLCPDIVHQENYIHSYPYDWRTKQPIIIRASKQWFIDTNSIKDKAMDKLKNVTVLPERVGGTNSLMSQLEKRPYWCISRQRMWGVPIPVLYQLSTGKTLISQSLINHFCLLLDEHGPDFWWTLPIDKLVGNHLEEFDIHLEDIEKGYDILDIWFDSGVSWTSVLSDKVADLCLEGVDQITGWFQSSLMTSVALRDKSPYRALFVHGFAVDDTGRKMSKSLGNVVDPVEITRGGENRLPYGTDALRWWVAAHSTQHSNITVSDNLLQGSAENVQKIRIVLRFILGCLNDFSGINDSYSTNQKSCYLDRYLLHLLFEMEKEVASMFDSYQFNQVCRRVVNFVTNDVSALYCHIVKNRLYCEPSNAVSRRSCQRVLKHLLEGIAYLIAPITPFLAEEVCIHYPPLKGLGIFRSGVWKPKPEWNDPEAVSVLTLALKLRSVLYKLNEETNTLKLHVKISAGESVYHTLKLLQPEEYSDYSQLTELLQVSSAQLTHELQGVSADGFEMSCELSKCLLCQRCRRYTAKEIDVLCEYCQNVVAGISSST